MNLGDRIHWSYGIRGGARGIKNGALLDLCNRLGVGFWGGSAAFQGTYCTWVLESAHELKSPATCW